MRWKEAKEKLNSENVGLITTDISVFIGSQNTSLMMGEVNLKRDDIFEPRDTFLKIINSDGK